MTAVATKTLSDTGVKIARVGHGLMLLTWRDPAVDDETAFEALRAGLDLVGPGEKVFLNSAEFYGVNPPTANLLLLQRFFAKYPEYRERAFISVKGGTAPGALHPDSSPSNLRRSVVDSTTALGSKIDLFEPARIDLDHSPEEIATALKELKDEGLFSHIGLSEISADTLRRASKITHITTVEIEVSLWAYDDATKDVIAAAKELGTAVVAYAPLGRGYLTGTIKREDIKPGDFRNYAPRFQEEAFEKNKGIIDAVTALAQKKGVSNAQLCIAWVASLGDHVIPLPGSSKSTRTLENFAASSITFTPQEKAELDAAVASFQETVVGHRYPEMAHKFLMV